MFLQPERVPVKVYLSTDKDAPRLDRTAGSLQTILKACLVTGYGDKEPAGWTMPFEDTAKGIKVFRPEISPYTDFFMRVSNDTGGQASIEVLQNMTSAESGEVKLEFPQNQSFYYIRNLYDEKWCIIATGRSFWLFVESGQSRPIDKNGSAVFCGDTAKSTKGERATALVYTRQYPLMGNNNTVSSGIFTSTVSKNQPSSYFNGQSSKSTNAICSPVMIEHDNEIYGLPIYMPSNANATNYQEIISHERVFINHGHGFYTDTNAFVPTDYWEY